MAITKNEMMIIGENSVELFLHVEDSYNKLSIMNSLLKLEFEALAFFGILLAIAILLPYQIGIYGKVLASITTYSIYSLIMATSISAMFWVKYLIKTIFGINGNKEELFSERNNINELNKEIKVRMNNGIVITTISLIFLLYSIYGLAYLLTPDVSSYLNKPAVLALELFASIAPIYFFVLQPYKETWNLVMNAYYELMPKEEVWPASLIKELYDSRSEWTDLIFKDVILGILQWGIIEILKYLIYLIP